MNPDPQEELWAAREEILREHDDDFDKVWETVFAAQKVSERRILASRRQSRGKTERDGKKSAKRDRSA